MIALIVRPAVRPGTAALNVHPVLPLTAATIDLVTPAESRKKPARSMRMWSGPAVFEESQRVLSSRRQYDEDWSVDQFSSSH
jgi:hypothetical protein